MNMENIKSDLHHLIDNMEDEQSLSIIKDFIIQLSTRKEGELWASLTNEQQNQVLKSYEKSKDPSSHLSQSQVNEKLSKWRSK